MKQRSMRLQASRHKATVLLEPGWVFSGVLSEGPESMYIPSSGRRGAVDWVFGLYFGGFLAAGPVPEARKWPRHDWGSILRTWRPFWTHFGPFSPIWGQTDYLRLGHCDIATIETSETSALCFDTRQMSGLATEDICLVSTADICPVSAADICPVSTADICPVSTENN